MPFEFREDITLEIPNVEGRLTEFTEGENSHKGLIIEVAAIHEGRTSNYNTYSKEELESAVESWVSPYPKPVILNHDPHSEAVGRVMAAKMDVEEDGTAFTRLQLAITDPAAIEKVLSQRYLTGSVGGKAEEANCSVCGENWAKASGFSAPCKHVRGRVYKGQTAEILMKKLSFKEYSWVNMPADAKSSVRTVGANAGGNEEDEEENDGWVRPARLFALSMDREEILEYTESEDRDVLSGMKKKDAAPLYLQLKGAFLSALAVEEEEEDVVAEEEEDILAVSETLSEDLAKPVVAEEVDEDAEEEAEEDESDEEEADAEEGTGTPADTTSADPPNTGGPPGTKRSEGQEKAHRKDVDAETSQFAPRNRQADDGENEVGEEVSDEDDLSEQVKALESRIEELTAREASLSEENTRLKTALKKTLVERVVDTKISLGLHERDERDAQVTEHMTRSASSLADSLRDLAVMTPVNSVNDYSRVPKVDEQSKVLGAIDANESERVFSPATEVVSNKPDAESVFVDALMGRRKL